MDIYTNFDHPSFIRSAKLLLSSVAGSNPTVRNTTSSIPGLVMQLFFAIVSRLI
jgi:hypothetical protein